MSPLRRASLLAVVVSAAAAGGCGGGDAPQGTGPPRPPRAAVPQVPPATGIDPHVLPPQYVPTQPTGRADRDAARVIRAWARDIRLGHLAAAARLFALPARFQNGTPVLTLHNRLDVLAVTSGFSCGAVVTHVASAGYYTLVRFRLTARAGGDCQGAEGTTTGGAIRVVEGRIRAWYRLYDPDEITPPTPGTGQGQTKI